MERERPNNNPELALVQSQARFLEQVGLWDSAVNRGKYSFRLSPDVLPISAAQKAELEMLNTLMMSPGGFFEGAVRLFQTCSSQKFRSTHVGGRVAKSLELGNRGDLDLQRMSPDQIPMVARLDLALTTPQDSTDRCFRILEIEGDKTHAFGYVTLADLFGRQVTPGAEQPPGIAPTLKAALAESGVPPDRPIALVVGREEMFYEQELGVFARLARDEGLNVVMIPERDVVIADNKIGARGSNMTTDTLMNLPVLTPEGKRGTGIAAEMIFGLFRQGKIRCLVPPKRFLGSKNLLALVSNGAQDPEVEEVLLQTFSQETLTALRQFIPRSILIGKTSKGLVSKEFEANPERWVIKKSVSSGMRGVALPNAQDKQRVLLAEALRNPLNFIMQEKVEQQTRPFRFAEPGKLDTLQEAPMFMRISPFVTKMGIATVGVTARETPDVHGSKDSIQISVVFRGAG